MRATLGDQRGLGHDCGTGGEHQPEPGGIRHDVARFLGAVGWCVHAPGKRAAAAGPAPAEPRAGGQVHIRSAGILRRRSRVLRRYLDATPARLPAHRDHPRSGGHRAPVHRRPAAPGPRERDPAAPVRRPVADAARAGRAPGATPARAAPVPRSGDTGVRRANHRARGPRGGHLDARRGRAVASAGAHVHPRRDPRARARSARPRAAGRTGADLRLVRHAAEQPGPVHAAGAGSAEPLERGGQAVLRPARSPARAAVRAHRSHPPRPGPCRATRRPGRARPGARAGRQCPVRHGPARRPRDARHGRSRDHGGLDRVGVRPARPRPRGDRAHSGDAGRRRPGVPQGSGQGGASGPDRGLHHSRARADRALQDRSLVDRAPTRCCSSTRRAYTATHACTPSPTRSGRSGSWTAPRSPTPTSRSAAARIAAWAQPWPCSSSSCSSRRWSAHAGRRPRASPRVQPGAESPSFRPAADRSASSPPGPVASPEAASATV